MCAWFKWLLQGAFFGPLGLAFRSFLGLPSAFLDESVAGFGFLEALASRFVRSLFKKVDYAPIFGHVKISVSMLKPFSTSVMAFNCPCHD